MAFESFFVSLALTAGFVLLLRHSAMAERSLDRPNHRSLHFRPTPRIGGVSIMLAVFVTLALFGPAHLPLIPLFLAACLSVLSLLDDRAHLPVPLRLVVHLTAAAIIGMVWLATHADMAFDRLAIALATVIAVCWMTNLFNFMDGADGMAGGMALIGFGGYAVAAAMNPMQGAAIAVVSAAVSGAALGFLFFNFPVAKVFMGDGGSVPIGFLAAAIGIQGHLLELWPWWFGALVFSPFIVDATVTLTKRIFRGEKIWLAHREHYYQRLILKGWSHRKTTLLYYFLMLGSTSSALFAQNSHLSHSVLSFWVITYSSLLLYLEWYFYQHQKDQTEDSPGAK